MIVRDNYKLVQAYLDYRRRVIQNDAKTVRSAESCLRHLLEWADDVPFQKASSIRKTFSEYMLTARNDNKPISLSPSRMEKTLAFARDFFHWARREHPGRFRSVGEAWIETLQVRRSAKAQSKLVRREYYTLEEVIRIIDTPTPDDQTIRFRRDKAALAFLFLSGMRDGAFVTLPIGAVDIARRQVHQIPQLGVQTKNSKAAVTSLLPIPRLLEIVTEWDAYVRSISDQPRLAWYTRLGWEGDTLDAQDLIAPERKFTGRVSALRAGLAALCELAGIPYKSPHKLRHGHGVYGIKHAKTIAELKALSQNMMHETVATTDGIYGRLADDDVARILATFTPD